MFSDRSVWQQLTNVDKVLHPNHLNHLPQLPQPVKLHRSVWAKLLMNQSNCFGDSQLKLVLLVLTVIWLNCKHFQAKWEWPVPKMPKDSAILVHAFECHLRDIISRCYWDVNFLSFVSEKSVFKWHLRYIWTTWIALHGQTAIGNQHVTNLSMPNPSRLIWLLWTRGKIISSESVHRLVRPVMWHDMFHRSQLDYWIIFLHTPWRSTPRDGLNMTCFILERSG